MSGQSKKIGLLGGSFNPAHEGHVYISKQALDILELDEIWWLVSPQNPLKSADGMAEFTIRLKQAKEITSSNPKIIISDFEKKSDTQYTYDTLLALKKEYPDNKFIWLMGADNAIQFHKWHKWKELAQENYIAIFNRDDQKEDALTSEFANEFKDSQCKDSKTLTSSSAPAWVFLDIDTHSASSTEIRKTS